MSKHNLEKQINFGGEGKKREKARFRIEILMVDASKDHERHTVNKIGLLCNYKPPFF